LDEAVFVVLVCRIAAAVTLCLVVWSTTLVNRPPLAQHVRVRNTPSSSRE
jgi:hypothetical protein